MAAIDYKQKIKDYMNSSEVDTLYKSMLNNLFPELKESEDERIRKELIEQVVYIIPNDDEVDSEGNVLPTYQKRIDKYRAWLEKKGKKELVTCPICGWEIEKQGELKSSWGEEDERKLQLLIVMCDETKGDSVTYSTMYREMEELKTWLKSLKERYTWKPSEGQLECLGYAIEKAEKDWTPLTNNRIYLTLKALKEQLKKL